MYITELPEGKRLPASSLNLSLQKTKEFLEASEESSGFFTQTSFGDTAPNTMCASLAIASIFKDYELPPGTIHTTQDLKFHKLVKVGDNLTCHLRVTRNQKRGDLQIMNLRIDIMDEANDLIMEGETSFITPQETL